MKLKKSVKIVLTIILLIAILGGGIFIYSKINKKQAVGASVEIESKIDKYGYELKNNQTSLYKKLFKELNDVLSSETIDEEEYLKKITELFITDFYSLQNKLTNKDVGGIQFVHKDIQENFILNAEHTMYQYIQSNIYGDRKQELPDVDSITIAEVEKISYKYSEKTDKEAYQVKVSWNYKKDLGYEKEKTLIFVHDDNKLFLVEMK